MQQLGTAQAPRYSTRDWKTPNYGVVCVTREKIAFAERPSFPERFRIHGAYPFRPIFLLRDGITRDHTATEYAGGEWAALG